MYNYLDVKPKLFTEEGTMLFVSVRDRVKVLLRESGAFTMDAATRTTAGHSWVLLACVDRLVELKEVREVTPPDVAGQHRVFVSP